MNSRFWMRSSPSTSRSSTTIPRKAWPPSARSARCARTFRASPIRRSEASLGHVSAARQSQEDDPARTLAPTVVGGSTSAGTRFLVLRPHAKGGLGQVFVARDTELNRDVALKEIQDQFAFEPRFRSRFEFEAEVTGGLEHPGIVPVYGLGHLPDGRPFYAMRFIKGNNLKEAIARFHEAERQPGRDPGLSTLELRELLGRFIDVCDAIAYAHSRGVLHRDLKPGNIMLGKYGETLVVDWGLAKALEQSEPESPDRTIGAAAEADVRKRARGDLGRLGDWHSSLHEPGAGGGPDGPARAAERRLLSGSDALSSLDRARAVRGGTSRRCSS